MPVPRGTGGLVSLSVIVILSGLIGLLLQFRTSRRRLELLAGEIGFLEDAPGAAVTVIVCYGADCFYSMSP